MPPDMPPDMAPDMANVMPSDIPSTMPRGIDHVVHAVRDLDAAADLYARLGFTVGARNIHPFGTHNRIIQFPGCFIELLAVAEPERIPQPDGRFSFALFNRDFLCHREGLSMLVLESRDAVADAAGFCAAGLGDGVPFRFARRARRPDGSDADVAFSLAFADRVEGSEAAFFVCQQHMPENFWDPAFQRHANGATGIAGVLLSAARPADHASFLSALAGQEAVRVEDGDIELATPRGTIAVHTPEGARRRLGMAPATDAAGRLQLQAIAIAVPDAALLHAQVAAEGFAAMTSPAGVVVAAQAAFGASLVFCSAASAAGEARR